MGEEICDLCGRLLVTEEECKKRMGECIMKNDGEHDEFRGCITNLTAELKILTSHTNVIAQNNIFLQELVKKDAEYKREMLQADAIAKRETLKAYVKYGAMALFVVLSAYTGVRLMDFILP